MNRTPIPVLVEVQDGNPVQVVQGRSRAPVRAVVDRWEIRSRWWGGEECRHYYCLLTARGAMELFEREENWFLTRILD